MGSVELDSRFRGNDDRVTSNLKKGLRRAVLSNLDTCDGIYEATASLWRPMEEMQSMMWTMWVLYLVSALVLP